jgi:hypothetical protein
VLLIVFLLLLLIVFRLLLLIILGWLITWFARRHSESM